MQKIGNELGLQPSSLETIDTGLHRFVNEELNLHVKTNKGFEKVPVIWLGAERSYQIKHKKELRDSGLSEGTIRLSIGLENSSDLIDDLKFALKKSHYSK